MKPIVRGSPLPAGCRSVCPCAASPGNGESCHRQGEKVLSWRGRRLNRRGATVVEAAVVVPVFFLLVFGIMEFGRMLMVQQAMGNAARHGCRKACLKTTTSDSQVEDAVREFLKVVVPAASDPDKVRVSVKPSVSKSTPAGTDIVVSVDVDFSDVTWVPGNLLGFGTDPVLRGASNMERE